MTLNDVLNLPPAFLVGLGLIALAIACIFVGVYFFGEEGIVAKTANFVAMAGLLMVLVFVIFFGHLINDAYLTELATDLGFDLNALDACPHLLGGGLVEQNVTLATGSGRLVPQIKKSQLGLDTACGMWYTVYITPDGGRA